MLLDLMKPFLGDYRAAFTGSQIARMQKLNQKTVSNTLNRLEKEGKLRSTRQGNQRFYQLNDFHFICALEHQKTSEFLRRHIEAKIALETIKAKGFVAVFGSYAKGQQRKGSDLDVFIAGTAEIRKTALPIHIDPKKYPLQTFKSRKDSDFLAGEVIRHHIIIQGVEEFVGICYEKYDSVVLTPEDRLKAPGAGRTER